MNEKKNKKKTKLNKNCATLRSKLFVVSCLSWPGCCATVAVLNACVNSHRIFKLDSNAMHIEQHASSPWLFHSFFFWFFLSLAKPNTFRIFFLFFVQLRLHITIEIKSKRNMNKHFEVWIPWKADNEGIQSSDWSLSMVQSILVHGRISKVLVLSFRTEFYRAHSMANIIIIIILSITTISFDIHL